MSLDTRLRDAMHEHVEGLESPTRTTDLVGRLQRAKARTQRRRTAGTLLAGALVIIGVLAVAGNQSSDSDLTTVADDTVEVESTDPVTGSVIDAPTTTVGPGAQQAPVSTDVDSGSTASTLQGGGSGSGQAATPGPAGSPSPAPGGAPAPTTTVLPIPPTTVAVPRPCTASLTLVRQVLTLVDLRASGTGEPGATIQITTLAGNHPTTVTPGGTWSVDFSIDLSAIASITARCSTGEVIPLPLLP